MIGFNLSGRHARRLAGRYGPLLPDGRNRDLKRSDWRPRPPARCQFETAALVGSANRRQTSLRRDKGNTRLWQWLGLIGHHAAGLHKLLTALATAAQRHK